MHVEMRESSGLPTVFHVTHWKAGSQWVRGVLEEAVPERIVAPLPGQGHVFARPIVAGGVYAPVYASEPHMRPMAGINQRTFVVVRDPRDTLTSWYFSLRYSHGADWETVPEMRRILEQVSVEDGLAILIRGELYDAINIQMTWLESGAKIFRYEDLLRDEVAGFRAIFEHCEIEISESRLGEIVAAHSFERRAGRKRGEEDTRAPLRKGAVGDWRNHFTERLQTLYRTLYGEATVRMGYAPAGEERW